MQERVIKMNKTLREGVQAVIRGVQNSKKGWASKKE